MRPWLNSALITSAVFGEASDTLPAPAFAFAFVFAFAEALFGAGWSEVALGPAGIVAEKLQQEATK